ncbi:MAG: hypothetical protein V1784_09470, partial [bacterium]
MNKNTYKLALCIYLCLGCGWARSDVQSDLIGTWRAICRVESNDCEGAYNAKEDAVGIAQIRMCLVRDVNRILGKDKYKSDDRKDREKSRQMWTIYSRHYAPNGPPERWAR